ncbi:MAG: IclR family transcriptional regulator [Novosphingobium sp.]|nr:IclR family transcriptional regulator [Novosphingobium sp.]
MAVKASRSGARILHALELIAQHQPVGVSDLARLLDANVAAAQRAVATLVEEGWIRPASGRQRGWELTAHIHTVAQHAHGSHDLRRRARGALEQLWQETGESVLLIVVDGNRFVVVDVLESAHYVRSAPPVGLVVPPRASATAWAILPFMSADRQAEFLDGAWDAELADKCAETRKRGFAVSRGDVFAGSTNIAAPIFEMDGSPVGALLVSVPNDRSSESEEARLGELVVNIAGQVSRGRPLALSAVGGQ